MRSTGTTFLLIPLVSIAALGADHSEFKAKPVEEYAHKQTIEKVTIAVQQYQTDEETREPFGKVNPYRYGVLPVFLVVQNDSPDAIRMDGMKLAYILPDKTKIESTPAGDLRFLRGAAQPKMVPGPLGGIGLGKSPKNPLAEWEIEGRAFAAKMIPPGQSASGFVYFRTSSSAAATVYISHLVHARDGQELFFFEIPVK